MIRYLRLALARSTLTAGAVWFELLVLDTLVLLVVIAGGLRTVTHGERFDTPDGPTRTN